MIAIKCYDKGVFFLQTKYEQKMMLPNICCNQSLFAIGFVRDLKGPMLECHLIIHFWEDML